MHLFSTLAVAAVLPFLASAHMQMSEPFPINSPEDPAVPANLKDNDYSSPLKADGSNFPCKGYHKQETSHVSKATYKAGGQGQLSIKGGASHNGGSCQISLSYDNGETWKVIESMIGGCPLTTSYDFTIPQDAPSSTDVLLAWTWFNKVGNREMYMNCARVTVEGSTPGRHRRAQVVSRDNAFDSLPDMYTCNLGKGCTTKEGEDVAFPEPGSNVINGGGGSSSSSGASGAGNGSGGSGAPAPAVSSPAASSPAAPAPSRASSAPAANSASPVSAPFPTGTNSTRSAPAPSGSNVVIPIASNAPAPAAPTASAPAAPTAPAAPAAPAGGSCTAGSIVCNSPTTWSMCVGTSLVSMGSVAAGTTCVDGKIA
ncbi:hypothetical protein EPUS_02752 [Endocarpon pusillum Z07020]|uniref:Extracellular protein n=1 Tax=Endocarpon pusillum (strain Z07020 / HMAS-L-300199) TaxID=1263415 RepID=U1G9C9_ENDPU|nr:uncharacterized protein EPUS_02752 [Endocarpon pusillum Z07020]ERF68296.1 hypothetical protein EPUS_02752 [Endocarpon pusillum Z07020]